ncbi:MAG: FAD-binding dehydrogenase [Chloroflexi bacterium HGW-Chloroflexi-10]|nr:MAG: FAD-binding dehydrogenase [Chloroflexi bacterium HGW-Chloroflexi-10]
MSNEFCEKYHYNDYQNTLEKNELFYIKLFPRKGNSKMSEKDNLVSRRGFLKKTALLGAGLAATGSMVACAPADGTSETIKWDKEVDVVVVGSGTVAIAAIAAKDAGAESVLILEKGPAFGGTSALSGGGFWIPMNYPMAAEGLEDNREDAYKYMKAISAGQSNDELINTYLDNANKMLEWLRDKFQYEWVLAGTTYQDYYEMPGFRPKGRQVAIAVDGKKASGAGAWQYIRATVDSLGIEVMTETAGMELVTNAAGEVIGVIAEGIDGKLTIKAKKGVILGTGGFDFNRDMTTAFLRGPIFASNAVQTNTGDGHLMGMALGADLRNMNSCWGLPFFPLDPEKLMGEADWQIYRGKPGAIVVNKYGERIGNEASAYHVFNRAFWNWDTGTFEWRNTPSFWICDSSFQERYFMPGSGYQVGVVPEWMAQAETLEELCEKLGINADGLNATLTVFNANAENGVDPDWHRGEYQFDLNTAGDASRTDLKNICLAPIAKGPFFGSKYVPGTCGTNGGLRINANAQVINVKGQPIPRLYAVGNTSGSVMGDAYAGGGSCLGSGGVFGMLAGRHAAGLESI